MSELERLELAALDADYSVIEAEKEGDEMAAARLLAQAIVAWEAYWREYDRANNAAA